MTPLTLTAREGDTLDQLVWRETGLAVAGVEAALRDNPGLAATGAVLPQGKQVRLVFEAVAPVTRPLVQLWSN